MRAINLRLRELQALDPDIPIMLEHLPNATEYTQAANYVRSIDEELAAKDRR